MCFFLNQRYDLFDELRMLSLIFPWSSAVFIRHERSEHTFLFEIAVVALGWLGLISTIVVCHLTKYHVSLTTLCQRSMFNIATFLAILCPHSLKLVCDLFSEFRRSKHLTIRSPLVNPAPNFVGAFKRDFEDDRAIFL